MDKFIEVYEFYVDYSLWETEPKEIELKEIALISFFKIADIYMHEYKNGWAILIGLDNAREFCYSICNSKENAYKVLNELKDKLNGRENG